jgi:hypothetical protein
MSSVGRFAFSTPRIDKGLRTELQYPGWVLDDRHMDAPPTPGNFERGASPPARREGTGILKCNR